MISTLVLPGEGRYRLWNGMTVTLEEPVLVRRSRWYNWFPSLVRLAGGGIGATMYVYPDIHVSSSAMCYSRSFDGGRSWDEAKILVDGGVSTLMLPDGDVLLLPYYLRPRPVGIGAPCNRLSATGQPTYVPSGVTVTGLPRPDRPFAPEIGTAGLVFNGQTVALVDGGWLATIYGCFEDSTRHELACVTSADGYHWAYRALIAGNDSPLPGGDGPSESAICRLPDGRIMCVFRNGSFEPYAQTWSEDEGRTWSPPTAMEGVFSVEPSLAQLPGNVLALSGGRPGIYTWFNTDSTATTWDAVDIAAFHNRCRPDDHITAEEWTGTTSYTEIISLNAQTLLLIYDRIANGWNPIPDEMDDTNSVWALRINIT